MDTTIMAQEIIVDNASYPTPKIGETSHNFRPLGLGFANLGALLWRWGFCTTAIGVPAAGEKLYSVF